MSASEQQPPLTESRPVGRMDPRIRAVVAAIGIGALVALSSTWWVAAPAAQAATDSKKTVSAVDYDPDYQNSPFPDLQVTVSQTQDLIQQGITVSWTGGKPSTVPNSQTGGQNFLQIMQCWGDEPGSNGTRPDRTTCQYGGLNVPGDMRWANREDDTLVAHEDDPYTAIGTDYFDATLTAIPFRSATGVTVASVVDGKKVPDAPDLDNNQFFTSYTTNEVSWAGSDSNGRGSVPFEVQTAQESPGLGCGAPVKAADGSVRGSSCWIVVLPRGTADAGLTSITKPGLFWETWKHHVAVRLGFSAVGVRCAIGASERQLAGSELAAGAVGQWQPKLCGHTGGAVYSLLTVPEPDAASAANGAAEAPLALTSQPLSPTAGTDDLAYAPVALSGVSVSFAIDRKKRAIGDPVPDDVSARERQAFSSIRLTPRLLAKLLTSSYTDALPSGADISHASKVRNITKDPEFLAINDPEWAYMNITGPGVGDALVPLGRSDAAHAIWNYILSDADARDFLTGVPDRWGMHVNPYYSTNPRVNPTGVGLALPRNDFPKADPVEFKGTASAQYADNINLVTWRPYTSSLQMGAYRVLTGDAQGLGGWNPTANPPKYDKAPRSLVGLQAVIAITDTSAASQYQVYQASLLNPAGEYVAPSSSGLSAAASAMTKDTKQTQVLSFDPSSTAAKAAKAAYPLAMPIYAAVNPAMGDKALRADYAAFISYAVSGGQRPGTADGELPDGYAPIPKSWVTQAVAAAAAIKGGGFPSASPSPSASSSPTAGASSATTPTSGSSPGASASAPSPHASGSAAPPLSSGSTPTDPSLGLAANVVPIGAAAGVAAAIGVPLVSRRRRRQP